MKRDLLTFVLVTAGAGVLFHSVTIYPMPWWPDTVIMGLPFGIVATLAVRHHRRSNRLISRALQAMIRRRRAASRL